MNVSDFSVTNNEVSQFARVTEACTESGNILDLSSSDIVRPDGVIRKVALAISGLLSGYTIPKIYVKDTIQVLRLSPGWLIKFDQTGHENDLCGTVESHRTNGYEILAMKHMRREKLLQEVIGQEYIMPEYWFYHDVHRKKMPYRITRDVSVRGKPITKSDVAPDYYNTNEHCEAHEKIEDIVHLYNLEEFIRGYSLQEITTIHPKLFRFLSALQSGLKKLQEEKKIYVDLTFRHNIGVIWRHNTLLGFRIYDTGTFFYNPKDSPDFLEITHPLDIRPMDSIHPFRLEAVGLLYKFLGIPYCQTNSK